MESGEKIFIKVAGALAKRKMSFPPYYESSRQRALGGLRKQLRGRKSAALFFFSRFFLTNQIGPKAPILTAHFVALVSPVGGWQPHIERVPWPFDTRRNKLGGNRLPFFGFGAKMLDKIRLHSQGQLPAGL